MNPLKADSRSNIGINPELANELLIPSGIDIPEGITALGRSIHLKGEIRAEEPLREGPVYIGREVCISLREVRLVVDPYEDQRKVLRQA